MTIEQLSNIFKNVAGQHLQINDYFFGSIQQAMAKSETLEYPALIISLTNVTYEKLRTSMLCTCYFIDKLQSGEGNLQDIIDDMERVSNDWFVLLTQQAWVKDYFTISNAQNQPIADRLRDNVAGWQLQFTLIANHAICIDELPVDGSVPPIEKCRIDNGNEGNIVSIGQNKQIIDSGYSFDDIAFKGDLPTQLSQLQDDATHRLVTDAEKSVWNTISKYKGVYTSLQSLISGVSNPQAGDWAHVDEGNNTDIQLYIYDATDNKWVLSAGGSAPEIDPIFTQWLSTFQQYESKGCTIDGCFALIPVNTKATTIVEHSYSIDSWFIVGYNSNEGDCTVSVDILKNGVSMIGSGTKPYLSTATTNSGNTTDWQSTNVTASDVLTYNVASNSDCVYLNIVLKLKRL